MLGFIFQAAADNAPQIGMGVAALLAVKGLKKLKANEELVMENMITGKRRAAPLQKTMQNEDGQAEHVGGLTWVNPFLSTVFRAYVGPQVNDGNETVLKTKDGATLNVEYDFVFKVVDSTKAHYNTNQGEELNKVIEAKVWDSVKSSINDTDYEDVVASLPDMQKTIIDESNEELGGYGIQITSIYIKEPMPKEQRFEDALNQRIINKLRANAVDEDLKRHADLANGIIDSMVKKYKELYGENAALPEIDIDRIFTEALHQNRISDAISADNQGIILDATRHGGSNGFAAGFAALQGADRNHKPAKTPVQDQPDAAPAGPSID